MNLPGLHHVTAIASDPRRNVDFYTRVLGLRLVKKTVNFDDPSTYHLYYADGVGTPGSVMTFFPWSSLRRGRVGTGQVTATTFSVPAEALSFWVTRLTAHQITLSSAVSRFGDSVLSFEDPDGLVLEIVGARERDDRTPWTHPDIAVAVGLRGFHGVTLGVNVAAPTLALLTDTMGYRVQSTEGGRTRLTTGAGGPGTYVDVLVDPALPRGLQGAGTVHHVAFRTPNDTTQADDLAAVRERGMHVSPVMDRSYFHSIYYREPAGILFEIATDTPGFATDETVEQLGTTLRLPPQYEAQRAAIEAALPKLNG